MLNKIVIIIQARMSSSRLPGKVLLPLQGKSLLVRMVERVSQTRYMVNIVVATSTHKDDDAIVQECIANNITYFRGSMDNLLERHYEAAKAHQADIVLKIPSDCPLIDPRFIDEALDLFCEKARQYDYVSNLHPASYPDGNDVEIMSMTCLEKVNQEATNTWELEHTTPYIWEHPELFKIGNVSWSTGLDFSMSHRFTIDYPEDYQMIKCVFDKLFRTKRNFSCNDILQLLENEPKIFEINAKYAGVNWYRNHLDDLHTIKPEQTKSLIH